MLDVKRLALSQALRVCMSEYICLDEVRAKDILRTHVCSIFDFLKENYSRTLSAYHWEQEIADEAIQITLTVWDTYNVSPPAWHWTEILRKAIVLHLRRPLGGSPSPGDDPNVAISLPGVSEKPRLLTPPPSPYSLAAGLTSQQAVDYAKAGIDLSSESPLLVAIAKQANMGQEALAPLPLPSPELSLVEQRKALLDAYKAKTGASHKQIWEGKSGIHKPEFYDWVNGKLPGKSQTAQNFERFLREGKRPTPRKPKK